MAAMLTIGDLILKSGDYLRNKGVDSPRLDAELLLAHVMGCDRLRLYLEWKKPVTELEVAAYRELIRSRGQDRVPVARLLGGREFYGRRFLLGPGAFVPRPETEGVVERALQLLRADPAVAVERPAVFEVGTGSGAIIVSLALEQPNATYIASDVSADALAVARRNATELHAGSRVEFRHGPLLAGYEGSLHLLVSNPPYIPSGQIPGLPPEVRVHDPMAALDGGEDGLDVVRGILREVRARLVPGGCVLLEIGEDQEEGLLEVFAAEPWLGDARVEKDLSGRPRYGFARRRVRPA